jgi:hypothetical protein
MFHDGHSSSNTVTVATSRRTKLTAQTARADEMRHASENRRSFPVGNYATLIHTQVPTLPDSMLPPSAGQKNKGGVKYSSETYERI